MSANAADSTPVAVEKKVEKAQEVASPSVEAIAEAVKTSVSSKNSPSPPAEAKVESKIESKVESKVESKDEGKQTDKTLEPATETKVESKPAARTEKPDTTEADAAHAKSAAEGRRLYIGNLAYSTTDEQLKEFFQGFSVESTSIPTNPRTGKAVGFAFVDLTTKEEADRAIEELSGQEVQDRRVSVQHARTGNGPKKEPVVHAEEEHEAVHEGKHAHAKKGRPGFRYRGRGRGGRGGKRGAHDEHAATEEAATAPAANAAGHVLAESTNFKVDAGHEAASGEQHDGAPFFKGRKKRGPPENGVPSATKIMVANLPYELSEEKLKELFADYQPESAKIALRPIPPYMVRKLQARGEPRKGRGFGFVNLASEEMQKKAVAEMNGKVVDGREIAVKVAIDQSQSSDSEDKENVGDESHKNQDKAPEAQQSAETQSGVKAEPINAATAAV